MALTPCQGCVTGIQAIWACRAPAVYGRLSDRNRLTAGLAYLYSRWQICNKLHMRESLTPQTQSNSVLRMLQNTWGQEPRRVNHYVDQTSKKNQQADLKIFQEVDKYPLSNTNDNRPRLT